MINENIEPMSLLEVFEKVREGCERYMYRIDDEGQCAESDEYVVALAFFDEHIEELKSCKSFEDKITDMVRNSHAHTEWDKNNENN